MRFFYLDYIRVIAIICIVVCHCCFEFNEIIWLGRYLGQIFNSIFLCLSAFLFGLKFKKEDYRKFHKEFIWLRLKRLSITYYPFLIIMFIFLTATNQPYNLTDVILHVLYLAWFDKLIGFEHLWFLTIIVFCYISIYLYSKLWHISIFNKIFAIKKINLILLCLILYLISTQINLLHLPGQFILYIGLYLFIFSNADQILHYIKTMKRLKAITLFLLTNIPIIFCYYSFNIFDYKNISYALSIICASSFFIFLVNTFQNIKETKYVSFISNISFEIYLIHHVLSFGEYSIYKLMKVDFITGFILVLIISIIIGYIFHRFSNYITKNIFKKISE